MANLWDRAAEWSARRWLRRLESRLPAGWQNIPAIQPALTRHVRVVRAQLAQDAAARDGLVRAPDLVLLAVYAEELQQEALHAGWTPPLEWSVEDGIALRLLACCRLAAT
jgi:hypothetical protein